MPLNMISDPQTVSAYRLLAHLYTEISSCLCHRRRAARSAGLAAEQFEALLAIQVSGGYLTVGALARLLNIQPHSATTLADRLAQRGLLTQRLDEDRRRVALHITLQGEQLLDIAAQHQLLTVRMNVARIHAALGLMLNSFEDDRNLSQPGAAKACGNEELVLTNSTQV